MGMHVGGSGGGRRGYDQASSIEKPLERQQDPGDRREVMEG